MAPKTRLITYTAVLSAIATVLMYFPEFPFPFFPPFLKFDFSDIPAFVGALLISPLAGVFIELVKNLLHLLRSDTAGVGELANFVVGVALILPGALIMRRKRGLLGALLGLPVGIVSMTLLGCLVNYYIMIPFYANVFPIEQIIELSAKANAAIHDLPTLVLYGIAPFNALKGLIVSAFTLVLYKKFLIKLPPVSLK